MRRLILSLTATALALAAHAAPAPLPKPDRDASKEDLKRMQGEWVLTNYRFAGRNLPPPPLRAVVKGRRFTIFGNDGGPPDVYELSLNSRGRPKALDMRDGGRARLVLATYSLRGDTFVLCLTDREEVRPRDLAANGGGEDRMTFRRAKKKR
jgi:uncharacterized protein (TIGR03067 family)